MHSLPTFRWSGPSAVTFTRLVISLVVTLQLPPAGHRRGAEQARTLVLLG